MQFDYNVNREKNKRRVKELLPITHGVNKAARNKAIAARMRREGYVGMNQKPISNDAVSSIVWRMKNSNGSGRKSEKIAVSPSVTIMDNSNNSQLDDTDYLLAVKSVLNLRIPDSKKIRAITNLLMD